MDPLLLCAVLTMASQTGIAKLEDEYLDVACQNTAALIEAAETYEVDPLTLAAIAHVESRWNPRAISHAGACGVMQVIPKYGRTSCYNLRSSPVHALDVGARMFRAWLDTVNGDETEALARYNAGYIGRKSSAGNSYSKKVTKLSEELAELAMEIALQEDERLLLMDDVSLP